MADLGAFCKSHKVVAAIKKSGLGSSFACDTLRHENLLTSGVSTHVVALEPASAVSRSLSPKTRDDRPYCIETIEVEYRSWRPPVHIQLLARHFCLSSISSRIVAARRNECIIGLLGVIDPHASSVCYDRPRNAALTVHSLA